MPETRVLVTGAGGFIGHHLVTFLKKQGYWVRGVDLVHPEWRHPTPRPHRGPERPVGGEMRHSEAGAPDRRQVADPGLRLAVAAVHGLERRRRLRRQLEADIRRGDAAGGERAGAGNPSAADHAAVEDLDDPLHQEHRGSMRDQRLDARPSHGLLNRRG